MNIYIYIYVYIYNIRHTLELSTKYKYFKFCYEFNSCVFKISVQWNADFCIISICPSSVKHLPGDGHKNCRNV